jgi:hypothetical protein
VGIVKVGDEILNQKLVEAGMAWVYDQYCKRGECSEWRQLQDAAKAAKVGLWSIPNPTPPWEFRRPSKGGERSESPQATKEQEEVGETYHGNASSHVFHDSTCRYYNCKNCTVVFKSREAAIKAGYRPCGICKP